MTLAALAAAGLVLTPALASAESKRKPPKVAVSFDPVASFTPANADPKLSAMFAKRGSALGEFKFTPAAAKGRPSQIRVAIRATSPTRARLADASATTASPAITALTPTSYNLGVAVGWRRFAVSGDVAKTGTTAAAAGRDSAVVGVSYSLKKFTGRVAVGAERADPRVVAALREPDKYSVDVGGAYNITRNIAVTGGVRYRIDEDRLLRDQRRDSQAVYVGTAFKF